MGTKYVEGRSTEFATSFEESGPGTPLFFILSPGQWCITLVSLIGFQTA